MNIKNKEFGLKNQTVKTIYNDKQKTKETYKKEKSVKSNNILNRIKEFTSRLFSFKQFDKKRTSPHQHKRLNFSLAHELGHIVLEHYKPYANTKYPNLDYIEDEADEFAGQFLVPEKQLLLRPYVEEILSDYFFVSTAVIQKRYLRLDTTIQKQRKDKNTNKLQGILDRYLFDI